MWTLFDSSHYGALAPYASGRWHGWRTPIRWFFRNNTESRSFAHDESLLLGTTSSAFLHMRNRWAVAIAWCCGVSIIVPWSEEAVLCALKHLWCGWFSADSSQICNTWFCLNQIVLEGMRVTAFCFVERYHSAGSWDVPHGLSRFSIASVAAPELCNFHLGTCSSNQSLCRWYAPEWWERLKLPRSR